MIVYLKRWLFAVMHGGVNTDYPDVFRQHVYVFNLLSRIVNPSPLYIRARAAAVLKPEVMHIVLLVRGIERHYSLI
jgi:hypothetical protein